ncbi:hypothetical protein T03_6616 [Trichinella britovi]|uniref:Uncharacterized protein n=1 Tax=Trichinella britovi TaxID=45882 RepID=A0A0V1AKZ1_TRIBR|nr:hypothetical protein T03_6616 [Trichinella britovi]
MSMNPTWLSGHWISAWKFFRNSMLTYNQVQM